MARNDQARNRARLIEAAAELVAREGNQVTMTDLAAEAKLSTATVYRHFSSVEEALTEYRFTVGMKLYAASLDCRASGVELLREVSRVWVHLVMDHGAAMVSTRSREGYLKRLRSRTRYLSVSADAMGAPIREAAAQLGIPDPGDEGMFLWNILFDPREIFDLVETVGLTPDQAADRLVDTFCGALLGWAGALPSLDAPTTPDS